MSSSFFKRLENLALQACLIAAKLVLNCAFWQTAGIVTTKLGSHTYLVLMSNLQKVVI